MTQSKLEMIAEDLREMGVLAIVFLPWKIPGLYGFGIGLFLYVLGLILERRYEQHGTSMDGASSNRNSIVSVRIISDSAEQERKDSVSIYFEREIYIS